MGYTDKDQLAINTIRLLAVGQSHYRCPHVEALPNAVFPHSLTKLVQHLLTYSLCAGLGRCYLQSQFRASRCPYGHGARCSRPLEQIHELQPSESRLAQQG